ncbi:MAG: putative outer membrane protein [Polyangiaceae bacterium]|jgi:hypothetical protein|nr:putative outer membrane protein [Polyangiaceae bacterium]
MLWSVAARAQVNVEPLRQQLKQDGWGGRVQASVSAYAGNTEGVILGSAGFFGARGQRNIVYTTLRGDYARLNRAVSVAKWFAHGRHNYEISDMLWWEVYGQIESDRFRRVALRELAGTGPRVALLQADTVELFYGISYMYEHEDFSTDEPSGDGTAHRVSNYLAVTLKAQERIVLTNVTYFQPRLTRFRDVDVLSVSSADFTITKRLHSRLDATVRYSSVLPADIERFDLEFKNSLELLF